MLALAEVGPEDLVYDLGCGDGRIVVEAARRLGARGVCVEIEADLLEMARDNARAAGVEGRIRFLGADLFRVDLRDATVVTIYLNEGLDRMLRPKLFRELRVGARVVSHRFGMGAWRPDATSGSGSDSEPAVHLWVVPALAGGTWRLETSELLRLHQRFGSLDASFIGSDAEVIHARSALLHGSRIVLELPRMPGAEGDTVRVEASVDGDVMQGEMRVGGVRRDLLARRLAARTSGVWTWADPERTVTLELDARSDPPRAALLSGRRRPRPVEDLLLFGDSLLFSVPWPSGPRRSYSGLVEGDRIVGTRHDRQAGESPWIAIRAPAP